MLSARVDLLIKKSIITEEEYEKRIKQREVKNRVDTHSREEIEEERIER
jgi:hypothetical protein